MGIDGRTVAACVQQIANSRTRLPQDVEDVLNQLERDGLSNPSPPCAPDSGLLMARGAKTLMTITSSTR